MKNVPLILMLWYFITLPAYAAIIDVNTSKDELNANGDCSLREAIRSANTDAAVYACIAGNGADTIKLTVGTYILEIPGTDENDANTGDLDITESLTLIGSGFAETIIDGGARDRVLEIIGSENTVEIWDLTIQNGKLIGGGGSGIRNEGILTLQNVAIIDNVVTATASWDGTGGGLFNQQGTVTLFNSNITDNQARAGGGIFNAGSSTLILTNSTVSGNKAFAGGGVLLYGTATLKNVTISGNNAANNGGGLRVDENADLINCTVARNSCFNSDGLYNAGIVALKNTLFVNGTRNCWNTGTIMSNGHNLESDNSCGLTAPTDLINADPMIGSLKDNGGPTPTHALLPGSPAIDAGDNTGCPSTDQRGITRPQGAACEIGAYECDIGGGRMYTRAFSLVALPSGVY